MNWITIREISARPNDNRWVRDDIGIRRILMRVNHPVPSLGHWLRRVIWPALVVAVVGLSLNAYGEKASSADAFVDSVGINVHLHNFDTPYNNFAKVEPALKALHVRHVRDGLIDTTWKDYYNRHNELGRAGIKGIFITSPNQTEQLILSYPSRMIDSFEGYEAPNEYDLSGNPTWALTLSNFLVKLDQIVKGHSQTSKFRVIGPSLTKASSFSQMEGSCSFDYSNLHNYFSGRNPGTVGWGSNAYGSITWNLSNVNLACPAKPVITTETGYQTITTMPRSVPESVAAKYVPRVFLEQWLRGIRRTYLYELVDLPAGSTSADKGFGLLHSDFSPKPAYTALVNLLSLLTDPGPAISPGDFQYQLGGDLTGVHHALFQKRNGSFYLALWVEAASYDVDGKKVIAVPAHKITVQTTTATGGILYALDAAGRLSKQDMASATTRTLNITDAVSILEFGSHPAAPTMNTPSVKP